MLPRLRTAFAASILLLLCANPSSAQLTGVFTYHNDNGRTGQNLAESVLTPSNVASSTFGRLFLRAVDGDVFAQPLYANGVVIGSNPRQVVYVATEHDSVYAFDATGARRAPFWRVDFLNPRRHITTIKSTDVGTQLIVPEIGITGTPVIDPSSATLYVVAATHENSTFVQRLHALDLATGQEKFGGPVVIAATLPGTGSASSNGTIAFDARINLQRCALLLQGGVVYIAWASHSDIGPYHGWVMGYDAATLAQVGVWNASPNGAQVGIWMSGAGLSSDASGNLFLSTGNGTFDANTGGADFGDSFVKLSPASSGLIPLDFATPSDESFRETTDTDLGSGGMLILPDQSVGPPHLMIEGSKGGIIYVVNRDTMGGFTADDSQMQVVSGAISDEFGTPALFNSTVYFGAQGDNLKAFAFNNGVLASTPSSASGVVFPFPGTTPSISANGSSNGIVWTIQRTGAGTVLRAFDASDLSHELYNSTQARRRDLVNTAIKFTVPTVADGRVFVGSHRRLTVFGLLPRRSSLRMAR